MDQDLKTGRRYGLANRGRTLMVAMALLVGSSAAHAGLFGPACLAKKLKEWGKLRKCQATENAKALEGRPADLGKCQAKFDLKLAAINAKSIPCRYGVNGDGTATDYDTGLVWERKTDDGSVHDKDNSYAWNAAVGGTTPNGTVFTEFLATLNTAISGDGTASSGCFAGHCDWRLPTIEELLTIVDPDFCGTAPCIDQVALGPTDGFTLHWSATRDASDPDAAWVVYFSSGGAEFWDMVNTGHARAVRSGL